MLGLRGKLIDARAAVVKLPFGNVFHPHSIRDVLVNRNFEAGAWNLNDAPALAALIESVVAEADARGGQRDARSEFLIGQTKDILGADPEVAARYYAQDAGMLAAERSGFFDLRRRGTVIENRSDIVRDLAIRLLSPGREADAFAAFESVRSRGPSDLSRAMARPDVTADDRQWLAG